MIKIKKRNTDSFSIDISSLVDVLFTLLIFFSLTSSFVHDSALKVNLPKASSSGTVMSTKKIEITIKKDGTIFQNKKQINLNTLKKNLQKLNKSDRMSFLMVVKADSKTTHGNVTKVLDMLKLLGFGNVAIATRTVK